MFRENLIQLRKLKGLSQEELAEKIQVSRQTLSKYETGENDIPTAILIKLARFYGTSIDYLLGETGERRRYPELRGGSE